MSLSESEHLREQALPASLCREIPDRSGCWHRPDNPGEGRPEAPILPAAFEFGCQATLLRLILVGALRTR